MTTVGLLRNLVISRMFVYIIQVDLSDKERKNYVRVERDRLDEIESWNESVSGYVSIQTCDNNNTTTVHLTSCLPQQYPICCTRLRFRYPLRRCYQSDSDTSQSTMTSDNNVITGDFHCWQVNKLHRYCSVLQVKLTRMITIYL